MCEKRYVGSRVLAWEICFGANNEVTGFEVVQRGENLRSVEGGIQRHQYRAQLEERICGL